MRPAAEIAREWLDADGPTAEDVTRHMTADGWFDPDAYEHARLAALIEAARREGAEQMRESAAQEADAPIPPPKNSPRIRRPYRAVIAAAIRALPLPGEG